MGTFQTLTSLVLLIFVLSVIVQAAQELVKSALDTKCGAMEQTLVKFMGRHLSLGQVKTALAERGLDVTALEHLNKADFRQLLDAIPFEQEQLQGVVASAQATADQVKDSIAASYEGMRASFQQLYTTHNKQWAAGLSLLVVVALNANLLVIYDQIASDQAAQEAIVGRSVAVSADQNGPNGSSQAPHDDLGVQYARSRDQINIALQAYPVLLRTSQFRQDFATHPLSEIAGLLIMSALVSLGAPFWNDILKGMMGLNNSLNSNDKKAS